MNPPSIQLYIYDLAQQAERTIDSTRAQLKWMPVVLCGLAGAVLPATLLVVAPPVLVLCLAVFGAMAGVPVGSLLAQRMTAEFDRDFAALRRQIHANLLDRGLLQLVLEHNPFERLPSLAEALPALRRPGDATEGGPMRERLPRFVISYSACCAEAGLPQPQGSWLLSLGGLGKWRSWLGAGLAVLGPVLAEVLNSLTHSMRWSLYALLAIGAVVAVRWFTTSRNDNTSQLVTGLLPTAVELELVAILSRGVTVPGLAAPPVDVVAGAQAEPVRRRPTVVL